MIDAVEALEAKIKDLEHELQEEQDLSQRLFEDTLGPLKERAKELLTDMYLDILTARTFHEVRALLEDLCKL